MTELEVKENKFYLLRVEGDKRRNMTLHNDIGSPISRIKNYLKTGVIAENIELMKVEVKEDKFELTTVPWSTIAAQLVKGEK